MFSVAVRSLGATLLRRLTRQLWSIDVQARAMELRLFLERVVATESWSSHRSALHGASWSFINLLRDRTHVFVETDILVAMV